MFNDWDDLVDSSLAGSFSVDFSSTSMRRPSTPPIPTPDRNATRGIGATHRSVDPGASRTKNNHLAQEAKMASSPLPPPNNSNDNGRSDNDTTNNATSGNDGRTWEEFDRTSTTQLELDDLLVHTPDWTLCAVCNDVYSEPLKWFECDHSFCRKCVSITLTSGHRHCPLCRQYIPNDVGIHELVVDTQLQSKLDALLVRCRWGMKLLHTMQASPAAGASPDLLASSTDGSPSTPRSANTYASTISMASPPALLSSPPLRSLLSSTHNNQQLSESDDSFLASSPGPSWRPEARLLTPDSPQLRHALVSWVPGPEGCPLTLQASQLEQHHQECPHALVICRFPGCNLVMKRSEIHHHQSQDCPFAPIPCTNCDKTFPRASAQFHELECPEAIVHCPNEKLGCAMTRLPRKNLASHRSSQCLFEPRTCPHKVYGCKWRGPRGDLETKHLASRDDGDDGSATTCQFATLAHVMDSLKEQVTQQAAQIRKLEGLVDQQQSEIRELRSAMMRPGPSRSPHHGHNHSNHNNNHSSFVHGHHYRYGDASTGGPRGKDGHMRGNNSGAGGAPSHALDSSIMRRYWGSPSPYDDDGNSPDDSTQFGLQMFSL